MGDWDDFPVGDQNPLQEIDDEPVIPTMTSFLSSSSAEIDKYGPLAYASVPADPAAPFAPPSSARVPFLEYTAGGVGPASATSDDSPFGSVLSSLVSAPPDSYGVPTRSAVMAAQAIRAMASPQERLNQERLMSDYAAVGPPQQTSRSRSGNRRRGSAGSGTGGGGGGGTSLAALGLPDVSMDDIFNAPSEAVYSALSYGGGNDDPLPPQGAMTTSTADQGGMDGGGDSNQFAQPRLPPLRQRHAAAASLPDDTMSALIEGLLSGESSVRSVTLATGTITQKSYENEHRHMVPPPFVRLQGSWGGINDQLLCRVVVPGQDTVISEAQPCSNEGVAHFRTLWVIDKAKVGACSVEVVVEDMTGPADDLVLGAFASDAIRIVPKPGRKASKRNQVPLVTDQEVLFYFKGSPPFYLADSGNQGLVATEDYFSFKVLPIDGGMGGALTYGTRVVLLSPVSGWQSPPLELVRVEQVKKEINMYRLAGEDEDEDDSICALHRVALVFTDAETQQRGYLGCGDDGTVEELQLTVGNDPSSDSLLYKLGAEGVWVVTQAAEKVFRFVDSPDRAAPVTPIPTITNITRQGSSHLHITGSGFTEDLEVWFGDLRVPSECRCGELILCQVPPTPESFAERANLNMPAFAKLNLEVPVTLVRGDGVLFPTERMYAFPVKPARTSMFSFSRRR